MKNCSICGFVSFYVQCDYILASEKFAGFFEEVLVLRLFEDGLVLRQASATAV